jgi:signal transduction histidine kinase
MQLFKRSLKTRIIFSFCLVMLLLVVIMAVSSYRFVRTLYLNQLSDHVRTTAALVGRQLNPKFIQVLEIGKPTLITRQYFAEFFTYSNYANPSTAFFIFNKEFTILIHSVSESENVGYQPRLILNRKEVFELKNGESTASFPFKGGDNAWYLWGFYRLDSDHWLGIQESAHRLQRVEEFARLFWYAGLGSILVTILLGWWLANRIMRPIAQLATVSAQIGKGNLQVAIPEDLPGELDVLTRSMDKMRDDLKIHQREKEELLAHIAHEIRNPLGGMELLVNLTKEDMQAGKQECRYLDRIIKEIAGLKQLITAYLNFSRPTPVKPEKIVLGEVIEEVKELLRDQLTKRNVSIEIDGTLNGFYFDRQHLRQIFLNLATNSLEATPDGLTIRIRVHEKSGLWEIVYEDNGPGIPDKDLDTIFQPFFTTKRNGTGLGLSVSKKLCRENGADLTAAASPNGGSLFMIKKTKEV